MGCYNPPAESVSLCRCSSLLDIRYPTVTLRGSADTTTSCRHLANADKTTVQRSGSGTYRKSLSGHQSRPRTSEWIYVLTRRHFHAVFSQVRYSLAVWSPSCSRCHVTRDRGDGRSQVHTIAEGTVKRKGTEKIEVELRRMEWG